MINAELQAAWWYREKELGRKLTEAEKMIIRHQVAANKICTVDEKFLQDNGVKIDGIEHANEGREE